MYCFDFNLTPIAPNTTIAVFADTIDPDKSAHLIRIYSVCLLVF